MKEFPIILSIGLFIAWIASWVAFYFYRKKRKACDENLSLQDALIPEEFIPVKEASRVIFQHCECYGEVNWQLCGVSKEEYSEQQLWGLVERGLISLYGKEILDFNGKITICDEMLSVSHRKRFGYYYYPEYADISVKSDEFYKVIKKPDFWMEEPKYTDWIKRS